MKLNKLLLAAGVLAVCGTLTFAQDFDDFSDFGDFGGSESGFGSSSSKIEVNGSASLDVRAYVDVSDVDDAGVDDVKLEATPSGTLDLSYSGNKSDMSLSLNVNADKLKEHPEDVIDELVLRGYFGNLTLEAGKMKIVWGKGDKLHVIDNFNADDYSDFIIPDYLNRRISTPMIRGVYSLPFANMNIEAVYTPFLPVDRFATNGRWTPAQVSALTGAVTASTTSKVADAFETYTAATATVGGTGAAYEVAKTSAEKAKKALATANAAYETIKTTYDSVNEKYNGIFTNYATMKDSNPALTWENYLADLNASGTLTSENLEELRKGYAEAAAAYYAATAAKETAQTTYDGYVDAQNKAADAYKTAQEEAGTAGSTYMYYLTYANALSADPSVIYPDMWNLKYGQFGTRTTFTVGQIDLGASYYNGWYKQPSFNASKLEGFILSYLEDGEVSEEEKFLAYDKKQTFGLEASSIIWHFNVRGEFAYNLTDDVDGTDPWVHNNSIAWLGGFDIDLPFWNANLNVQEYGTFILHGSECDDNAATGIADVDYALNTYSNNKVVCNFTSSFMNDRFAPEVTVMYGIENGDVVVLPKLAFKSDQNLTFTASGMYIWCKDDNSEFSAWKHNSFVAIGASCQF